MQSPSAWNVVPSPRPSCLVLGPPLESHRLPSHSMDRQLGQHCSLQLVQSRYKHRRWDWRAAESEWHVDRWGVCCVYAYLAPSIHTCAKLRNASSHFDHASGMATVYRDSASFYCRRPTDFSARTVAIASFMGIGMAWWEWDWIKLHIFSFLGHLVLHSNVS